MDTLLQTVTMSDARARFAELVNLAFYNNATIVVTRMDKPTVKITKVDDNAVAPKRDISDLIGAWGKDGDTIAKYAKKFRKEFKFIRE